MISMNLKKKTKTKVLVVKRKYFGFGGKNMCGKQTFFHIRLQLIIWETSVSVFFIIFIIVQTLTFFVKNKKKCPILFTCGEAAFAFAERENWLSFRSSSSSTSPNFQIRFVFNSNRITCVEEQHYVRAWSKGQYVKNTSCSQFPPKLWPFFCWEFDQNDTANNYWKTFLAF